MPNEPLAMRNTVFTMLGLPATLAAIVLAPASADGSEWLLMERHGGCVSLYEAGRRQPALAGIAGPDGFVDRMRRQGRGVTVTEMPVPRGAARIVEVPTLNLSLIFVSAEVCDAPPPR